MTADCMGSAKYGRCPITAIATAKGPEWDPEVRGPTNLILEWCRFVPQIAPQTPARAWTAMEEHIQGGNQWAKVVGPMRATYMHLKEMGWQIEMDDTGHISGLLNWSREALRPSDAVTWTVFKDGIERTRIKMIWAKASAHEESKIWNLEWTSRWPKDIIKGSYR